MRPSIHLHSFPELLEKLIDELLSQTRTHSPLQCLPTAGTHSMFNSKKVMHVSRFAPQNIKCNLESLQSQTACNYFCYTHVEKQLFNLNFLKHFNLVFCFRLLSFTFLWKALKRRRCNKCRSDDAAEFYVLALFLFVYLLSCCVAIARARVCGRVCYPQEPLGMSVLSLQRETT